MSTTPTPDVWFITGANTGFGLAIARSALRRGMAVVATARRPEQLADLAAAAADRVLALPLDVTQAATIDPAVDAAIARFGRIDVLVNNAGYGFMAGLEEASDAEARAQFDVNFFGAAAVARAVLPAMRRAGRGTIVMMSSIAGQIGTGGGGFYAASKFALEGLSEALAQELAPFGIRTLIVEPGAFRTEFFGRSLGAPGAGNGAYRHLEEMRTTLRSHDGQQVGDPVRAAEAILDTVAMADMPLRLPLGRSAYRRLEEALRARLADMARSRELAEGSDFPRD